MGYGDKKAQSDAATRKAADSLDRVHQGKQAAARRGISTTRDDTYQQNVEKGRSWGSAKRNPKG